MPPGKEKENACNANITHITHDPRILMLIFIPHPHCARPARPLPSPFPPIPSHYITPPTLPLTYAPNLAPASVPLGIPANDTLGDAPATAEVGRTPYLPYVF